MDKENIKIGNVWIEDSKSIEKRYFLLALIYLYDSNAENAKKWFEEQNKKNKIII